MTCSPESEEHSSRSEHSSPSCLVQPFSSLSMLQSVRVLPSNAPPLEDTDTKPDRYVGVLQEHSGNRQLTDQSYSLDLAEKRSSFSTENKYTAHAVPTPDYQNAVVLNSTLGYRPYKKQTGYAGNKISAKYLYARFRSSDQYIKYRSRQKTNCKRVDEPKWPDRLEDAFFQALVRWPPMGRRKLHHKGKQRGRNELISDHIMDLTGEYRCRKQISSHIQVLKPFIQDDPYIMSYLAADSPHPQAAQAIADPGDMAYLTRRRMARYTANNRFKIPQIDKRSMSHAWNQLEIFKPTDFEMFVQRKIDKDNIERLHTYTSTVPSTHQPTPEDQIETMEQFGYEFPLLAMMHQKSPIRCNVLLAESSIALSNMEAWKNVELGISFFFSSAYLPASAKLVCRNSFYRNNSCLKSDNGIGDPFDVNLSPAEDGSDTTITQVKFGSTFWASTLAHISARLRENSTSSSSCSSSNPNPDNPSSSSTSSSSLATSNPLPPTSQSPPASLLLPSEPASASASASSSSSTAIRVNPWEEAHASLSSITICQDFHVLTTTSLERLLLIQWKFSLAAPETQGRTSWRRLLLPRQEMLTRPRSTTPPPPAAHLLLHSHSPLGGTDLTTGMEMGMGMQQYIGQQQQQQPSLQSPFEYRPSPSSLEISGAMTTGGGSGPWAMTTMTMMTTGGESSSWPLTEFLPQNMTHPVGGLHLVDQGGEILGLRQHHGSANGNGGEDVAEEGEMDSHLDCDPAYDFAMLMSSGEHAQFEGGQGDDETQGLGIGIWSTRDNNNNGDEHADLTIEEHHGRDGEGPFTAWYEGFGNGGGGGGKEGRGETEDHYGGDGFGVGLGIDHLEPEQQQQRQARQQHLRMDMGLQTALQQEQQREDLRQMQLRQHELFEREQIRRLQLQLQQQQQQQQQWRERLRDYEGMLGEDGVAESQAYGGAAGGSVGDAADAVAAAAAAATTGLGVFLDRDDGWEIIDDVPVE